MSETRLKTTAAERGQMLYELRNSCFFYDDTEEERLFMERLVHDATLAATLESAIREAFDHRAATDMDNFQSQVQWLETSTQMLQKGFDEDKEIITTLNNDLAAVTAVNALLQERLQAAEAEREELRVHYIDLSQSIRTAIDREVTAAARLTASETALERLREALERIESSNMESDETRIAREALGVVYTHGEGCRCARADCTLRRLRPISDPEIAEALRDVGLSAPDAHGDGCQCARADCTMRRMPIIPADPEITEALIQAGAMDESETLAPGAATVAGEEGNGAE